MSDKVKYTHIAFYRANWDVQPCQSFEEAKAFLEKIYDEDGKEGFAEETIHGYDFIAEITHKSSYVIDDSKDNYDDVSLEDTEDYNEWPYSDDADTVGHVEMIPVKPTVSPERLAEIIEKLTLDLAYITSSDFYLMFATELIKTLDIRGKGENIKLIAPLWYTTDEIESWLKRNGHPEEKDLPAFLALHFQAAFQKGWDKAMRTNHSDIREKE